MEIMKTAANRSRRLLRCAAILLLLNPPSLLASEILLQNAPLTGRQKAGLNSSHFGPQATFALVNYSLKSSQNAARALYVSSGDDLSAAESMIDNQTATSFAFSTQDKTPTALIDFGKRCVVRRLSVTYSARPGSFDFYVMQSLPGPTQDNFHPTLQIKSEALKPVGSTIDDGSQGHASIEIPSTNGRYVMVRWIPASHDDVAFSVAEISAIGSGGAPLLASSGRYITNPMAPERTVAVDAKDVPDAKDIYESKDIPAEAPEPPPPLLPDLPPFSFIPIIVPASE